MKKIKIKHTDGKIDVLATPFIYGKVVNLEYKFEGITYGRTISIAEAIVMGVIERVEANNSFRDIKQGNVYKILSYYFTTDDIACDIGDMIIVTNCGEYHYSNFNPTNKLLTK